MRLVSRCASCSLFVTGTSAALCLLMYLLSPSVHDWPFSRPLIALLIVMAAWDAYTVLKGKQ